MFINLYLQPVFSIRLGAARSFQYKQYLVQNRFIINVISLSKWMKASKTKWGFRNHNPGKKLRSRTRNTIRCPGTRMWAQILSYSQKLSHRVLARNVYTRAFSMSTYLILGIFWCSSMSNTRLCVPMCLYVVFLSVLGIWKTKEKEHWTWTLPSALWVWKTDYSPLNSQIKVSPRCYFSQA